MPKMEVSYDEAREINSWARHRLNEVIDVFGEDDETRALIDFWQTLAVKTARIVAKGKFEQLKGKVN